ncbi:hypothetical protein BDZ91DRAFT_693523 [Kalaharituber pfeilii]|nr:hypothetical protein BDZ91DRAFT_693523 [Kalaharituber pfeilii]
MSIENAKTRLKAVASHLAAASAQKRLRPVNRHELSPTYFLPRAAELEPNAEAIIHTTSNGLTIRRKYAEFAERAAGLGWFLKKHGLKKVGLLMPNTSAYLEGVFGIGGAGCVQVGINYRLKKDDIHYIFNHAGVNCVLVDKEYAYLLEGFNPMVRIIVDLDEGEGRGQFEEAIKEGWEYDRKLNGGSGKRWDGLELEPENEDDLIALAYTSGTTARPKGVEYTHRGVYLACMANVIESGLNVQTVLTKERARYLAILPFFHATGWTVYWSIVAVRGTHYCLRKVDYDQIWYLLKNEGITHFNAAPTVNTLLVNHPKAERLQREVRVTVAASPPTAKLFESMIGLNLMPVHVYGMTETYGPITKGYFLPEWHNMKPEEMYMKMARQGHGFITSRKVRVVKPQEGESISAEVVDVERNGKEIGEIVFSGNICSRGYYNDPTATSKLFSGRVLHSGDLAVHHPDGSIQILDRQKDIIISGGENISSVALESMLAVHPAILEVGIIGVPDEKFGERPRAYVTLKKDMEGMVSGEDVVRWAKSKESRITGFMVPREVLVVKELPKTSTGKVQKNVLREWAKGNLEVK